MTKRALLTLAALTLLVGVAATPSFARSSITVPKLTVVVDGPGSITTGGHTCTATCTYQPAPADAITITADQSGDGSRIIGVDGCPATGNNILQTCPAPSANDTTVTAHIRGMVQVTLFVNAPKNDALGGVWIKWTSSTDPSERTCAGASACSEWTTEGTIYHVSSVTTGDRLFTAQEPCVKIGPCDSAPIAGTTAFHATAIAVGSIAVGHGGAGSGTVTTSPADLLGCQDDAQCKHLFPLGQTVTLTAHPADGSTFAGWSGPCSGTGTCTLKADVAVSVTASFDQAPPPPPADGSGSGSGAGGGTDTASGSSVAPTALSARILSARLTGSAHRVLVVRVRSTLAAGGRLVLRRGGKTLVARRLRLGAGVTTVRLTVPKLARARYALALSATSTAQRARATRALMLHT